MLSTHGLDAVMILRVARTGLYMLGLMFLYGWVVVAPINATVCTSVCPQFLSRRTIVCVVHHALFFLIRRRYA